MHTLLWKRVPLVRSPDSGGVPGEEWTDADHVRHYLDRADEFPRRAEGEDVLLDHVPQDVGRVLDLGTGDGRLLALLQRDRERLFGIGLDASDVMLNAARERFAGRERIELVEHDLINPLPQLERFGAVVSSMARTRPTAWSTSRHSFGTSAIAGFTDVDCYWKWLEMALLIGVKPSTS